MVTTMVILKTNKIVGIIFLMGFFYIPARPKTLIQKVKVMI